MPSFAVFLDRDNTLIFDPPPGYLADPDKVQLLPGVVEGLKILLNHKFKLIIISNQSGIARGILTHEQVIAVNNKLLSLLKKENISLTDIIYCPHHPEFSSASEVECRKPSPKMIFEAAEKHSINLKNSYIIGDSFSDIKCGNNAGIKSVLVKITLSDEEINNLKKEVKSLNFVAGNFLEACKFIAADFSEENS
jgi:D,D-heptose 1,7-bisphosphate phosphatase